MTISLVVIGKTTKPYFVDSEKEYIKRLKRYIKFEYVVIPELKKAKNLSVKEIKRREADLIKKEVLNADAVVLLDEKGKQLTSIETSKYLQKKMNSGIRKLYFVVGGAYGFDDTLHHLEKLSLSKMTFSHQMIRTFLLEQIYRGFSILNSEPYHNE